MKWWILVLSVVVGAIGVVARGAAVGDRPNIVFILADDLGYGDLGCYGQKEILTPEVDRLAAEGLRFMQAYAGATVCAPSRCCLMTGLHGGHTRIRGNKRVPLTADDVTVADVLKKAGYATGLCGKWGLGQGDDGGAPNRHGFDYFFGYADQVHAHNYYPEFLWKNDQKFPLPNVIPKNAAWKDGQGVASEKKEWSHDLIEKEALGFMRANKDRPFFLYLPLTLPHANNEGKQAGMEVPSDAPYGAKDWPQQEKNKAAMITRMDATVGRVLALLKELKLDEKTLVIFASDNGAHSEGGVKAEFFHSSGPLRGIKRDLYEGGIRVPMIARWPGKIQAGGTSDFVTAFWDFLPTAAEVAGVKAPDGLDGISILPTLLGKEQKTHDYLYFEFHERGFDQAVRMGDWKGVRVGFEQAVELYDLKNDVGEKKNVASEHPEVVKKIEEIMRTARVESADFPVDKKVRPRVKGQAEVDEHMEAIARYFDGAGKAGRKADGFFVNLDDPRFRVEDLVETKWGAELNFVGKWEEPPLYRPGIEVLLRHWGDLIDDKPRRAPGAEMGK